VFRVIRKVDRQEYALKKVKISNLSDKEKENALNEVRLLASVSHPNIVAYREAFLDEPSNTLCIVMEYADDGDVFQLISTHRRNKQYIPEERIWSILVQVVKGLQELHRHQILHRDMKSANIFLTKDGRAKLGDMNVSKIAKKGLLQTQTGTPYYASPEVWNEEPYNHKSDIWSLGCVIFEMCALKPPFRAVDMEGLYKKVRKGVVSKIPPCFSKEIYQLIQKMLIVKPERRPTCEQLLEHESIRLRDEQGSEGGSHSVMIKTIRMPEYPHYLTDMLPKPNYNKNRHEKTEANSPVREASLAPVGLPRLKKGKQDSPAPEEDYLGLREKKDHRQRQIN
jgi:NIMA (never in mitosis gene a)-related kinase